MHTRQSFNDNTHHMRDVKCENGKNIQEDITTIQTQPYLH